MVSIHAPARGATHAASCRCPWVHVSIHAPARGATRKSPPRCPAGLRFNPRTREGCDITVPCGTLDKSTCFNPRTREGCDPATLSPGHCCPYVSIHAPARGATWLIGVKITLRLKFQSTHPRGVRLVFAYSMPLSLLFQSTHPRGVRRP